MIFCPSQFIRTRDTGQLGAAAPPTSHIPFSICAPGISEALFTSIYIILANLSIVRIILLNLFFSYGIYFHIVPSRYQQFPKPLGARRYRSLFE